MLLLLPLLPSVCDFLQEPAAAQPLPQLENGQVACLWGLKQQDRDKHCTTGPKLKQSGTRAIYESVLELPGIRGCLHVRSLLLHLTPACLLKVRVRSQLF